MTQNFKTGEIIRTKPTNGGDESDPNNEPVQGPLKNLLAHSSRGKGPPQYLEEHLFNVAIACQERASKFGHGPYGYVVGFGHDIGKATLNFQNRLKELPHKDPARHPRLGALAFRKFYESNPEIAYLIEHHHGFLRDWGTGFESSGTGEDFSSRLQEKFDNKEEWLTEVTSALAPYLPDLQEKLANNKPLSALGIRMLHSCLIDSDWEDTAQFYGNSTQSVLPVIDALCQRSRTYYQDVVARAPDTRINWIRRNYYEEALGKANDPKGLFVLNMQVGTGKTLTHARFAMEHANHHDMDGIIIAVPYLAVVTQNVSEYKNLFGDTIVIESHSAIDWEVLSNSLDKRSIQHLRSACESWEGRVILTTTVELLETLYTHRNSRLRKLHNYNNKVVVIDEFQSIPSKFLLPSFKALEALIQDYGCSVILCSATDATPVLKENGVIQDYTNLVTLSSDPVLNRVTYEYHPVPQTWARLARDIEQESVDQVMCITNTVRGASYLFDALDVPEEHKFHLSNMMTTAHKARVIQEVQRRLEECLPVYLICTPVVEAGVDIDFPRVWRQECPLDRIIQAAGRCNRHGRRDNGWVTIFRVKDLCGNRVDDPFLLPSIEFTEGHTTSRKLFARLNETGIIDEYYRSLSGAWNAKTLDGEGILKLEREGAIRTSSRKFRLIDDAYVKKDIIIPDLVIQPILSKIRQGENLTKSEYQRLGHHTVSVSNNNFNHLEKSDKLEILENEGSSFMTIFVDVYRGGINEKGLAHELYHYAS